MHTTDHHHHTTNHAGFAPAPAEAHQEAIGNRTLIADSELDACVSRLEMSWARESANFAEVSHVQ